MKKSRMSEMEFSWDLSNNAFLVYACINDRLIHVKTEILAVVMLVY